MHPLNKKYFGPDNIQVSYHNGTAVVSGYIVEQISANRFVVTSDGITNHTVTLDTAVTTTSALTSGNATVEVFPVTVAGDSPTFGAAEHATKIQSKVVHTVEGHTYSWSLSTAHAVGEAKLAVSQVAILTPSVSFAATLEVVHVVANSATVPFAPFVVSGGGGTITLAISPALPTGLSFDTTTGAISGTPTVLLNARDFTVTASDTVSTQTASATFTLFVDAPVLNTARSPATKTVASGAPITPFTPVTSTGGFGTVTLAIAPALSTGLSFDTTTGAISGTPSAPVASTVYTITATDHTTPVAQTSVQTFNLIIT